MMSSMLNPLWLHTFKTLVEVGHFTETAKKLFMTQPGVSQHIQKLEASCGHSLIKRYNKQFELTEQGRLVYDYAKELETHEADLIKRLNFDDPLAGICKIACSGALALRLYPVLLNLQMSYPKLIIQLEVAPNQTILNDIESGDINFGVVTTLPDRHMFDFEEIGHDELCLILPKNISKVVHIYPVLKSIGLIHHPDALHYLSLYCAQCGITELSAVNINDIPISGSINQLTQILTPVAKGLGFTVLQRNTFEYFTDNQLLQIITPPNNVIEPLIGVKARCRELPARYETVISHIKKMSTVF